MFPDMFHTGKNKNLATPLPDFVIVGRDPVLVKSKVDVDFVRIQNFGNSLEQSSQHH